VEVVGTRRSHNFLDLTGQTFGRLTVLRRDVNSKPKKVKWVCLCTCGKETSALTGNLRNGHTTSCSCAQRSYIHGHCPRGKRSRVYNAWMNMRDRCLNQNRPSYVYYGGRGITICDRWLDSFENFLADMGEPPDGYELERVNNELGYSPENCVWANRKTQCRNTRSNRLVTYKGETRCIAEWSEILNMKYGTLRGRLDNNWTIERAFEKPVATHKIL
jgi:hypothetical protein